MGGVVATIGMRGGSSAVSFGDEVGGVCGFASVVSYGWREGPKVL